MNSASTRLWTTTAILLLGLGNSVALAAQADPSNKPVNQTVKGATSIVTQPVRDVGLDSKKIPDVLVAAARDPYSLQGLKTCRQIVAETAKLNEVLGADFIVDGQKKEDRASKLAEAGGKTVINALIPFRGLVREVSGAAPAQRRMEEAIAAGFARRGFLRGVGYARNCAA